MPLAILVLILSIAFAASPLLVPGFGGFNPDQFPVPQDNPPVQPAGYAFSIWGLIYLWLIASAVFGLKRPVEWTAMRPALAVSLAIGVTWLPVAMLSPVWAAILIWAMLVTALIALFRAPMTDKPWAAWPVGLYTGWLSAASCVSLGLLAAGYGWMSQQTAAYVFVGLAILLAMTVQSLLNRTPTYGLAVIWALIAVAVHNWDTATAGVAWLALIGAVAMVLPMVRSARV
ncbi:tryptophan-rich sensory protein [Pseudosulfitobacter pseudonitzschiae]|uniref:tryptophan-rich sensory protein n=1 Tax=Pseudosulfitobacter pseudonitzschiae TaxID=1402135 RepID=UPI001AF440F4|nr:tryptophan-rich sensory protein [Pseudosulfitobacter pseudonitzschiae]MBM1813552.1 tryptophan-rich sensory protein [Pseudosulfitobacter pseudonitzschiae]MBM1830545.1 tryptophan-rich sensory protein [Pseudosulfitobacter pseudonitzschiae]MBM1835412.1 tryptophan-rich sensory protein [Pseudosulfitobacter pseudonitzschiae]MBM1840258.1 tryptophan-rich sensory protein [Pseudosulfitobacter pseudonitzschiae]MBM1845754.1 tryptophan-rich sensory protein [Pseudosulfitobacter pseudonitzschiae]